jgi:hypothetical protein
MRPAQVAHVEGSPVVVVVAVAGLAASIDLAGSDGGVLPGEVAGGLLLGVLGVLSAAALDDGVAVPIVVGSLPLGGRSGETLPVDPGVPSGAVGACLGAVDVSSQSDRLTASEALRALGPLGVG